MEWIAAQLKFNCLLGQSKIWCTNEFSFCYTFPICHKWIFMSFHIGWSESGGQRRKFTFRRLAKTIFPDQSLLRRRLSVADYERREASTSSVAPTPCPSPPACLRDIRTHSQIKFVFCVVSFFVFFFSFPTLPYLIIVIFYTTAIWGLYILRWIHVKTVCKILHCA